MLSQTVELYKQNYEDAMTSNVRMPEEDSEDKYKELCLENFEIGYNKGYEQAVDDTTACQQAQGDLNEVEKAIIENLKQQTADINMDTPLMHSGQNSYSPNQIIEAIEQHTDFGKEMVDNIIGLTVDLLLRGKKHIPTAPAEKKRLSEISDEDAKMVCKIAHLTHYSNEAQIWHAKELFEKYWDLTSTRISPNEVVQIIDYLRSRNYSI